MKIPPHRPLNAQDLPPLYLDIFHGKICPYCHSKTRVTNEQEIYGRSYSPNSVICCVNYPKCDSYVGCHADGKSKGRLAGPKLRIAKKEAHEVFDQLWQNGYRKRQSAYDELADFLNLDRELTHIGMFTIETCHKVKRWALELLIKLSEYKPNPMVEEMKQKYWKDFGN